MIEGIKVISFVVGEGVLMILAENTATNEQAAFMQGINGLEVSEEVFTNVLRYGFPLNLKQAQAFFEDNVKVDFYQSGVETLYKG